MSCMLPSKLVDRFWSYVAKVDVGCWEWIGTRVPAGYGQIRFRRKNLSAHRLSYQIHHGHDPGRMSVCHSCDNPSCVRPEHLFLGTQVDNIADAMSKGRVSCGAKHAATIPSGENHWSRLKPERLARGVQNGRARLTESDVVEIRKLRAAGVARKALAARFHVAPERIWYIATGRGWKCIPMTEDRKS